MTKFEFNDQELALIGEGLGNLPFNKVYNLIVKIQEQVQKERAKEEVKNDGASS